ncbi:MAG: gamma-glutamyltransferase [Gammaproteobacteria bacterium]|nr:MAG: gamma-glutamyltransferase [Gammaproteobacteria bacterium]
MRRVMFIILSFTFVLASRPARAETTPIIDMEWPFQPVVGQHGMVVSEDALASRIGAEILAKGGNAVDAAVAVGFALAVTLPKAGNLGGGGFMMIYLHKSKKATAIDYRETAASAAHAKMFWQGSGIDKFAIRYSGKATAVPGTVAGLLLAHEKYGRLSRQEVMAPAIRLAKSGFKVSFALEDSLRKAKKRLMRCEVSRKIFFHDNGKPYSAGEIMKRPDLAWTLTEIQRYGRAGFYEGAVADKFVASIRAHDGLITKEDLKRYRAVERTPLGADFGAFRVLTMPPPSSGGVHLLQMLKVLSHFPLKALGPNRASTYQIMIEAMRVAYADRSRYLGDPDFVQVPVSKLISDDYAERIAKHIERGKAKKSEDIRPGQWLSHESHETTHFSVIDRDGNMVANTYTLNFSFGSGHTAEGTGILLNNEMDDFAARPGIPNAYGLIGNEANAIAPGKRPLSSMTPTLVLKNNRPWLATGSPGGSTIITTVLQVLLNTMVHNMNIASAVAWPRIHHQWLPDKVFVEPTISQDTVEKLRTMGYDVVRRKSLGGAQSIMFDGQYFYGAPDPRKPGSAAISVDLVR